MPNNSFQKKHTLDPSVFWIFLVIAALATALLIYRWYNYEECPVVDFQVAEHELIVGELVEFTCKSDNIESIKWDFGDGVVEKENMSPAHIFEEPGEYAIILTVNGTCTTMKKILVNPKKIDKKMPVIPKFSCPSKVFVGEIVRFRCLNRDAYSYEWNFGESNSVDSRSKNPTHTFRRTGQKTITLIVNNEKKYIASKKIFVKPKPAREKAPAKATPPPKPAPVVEQPKPVEPAKPKESKPKPTPVISNDEFQKMLVDYAKGKVDKNAFSPYLYNSPDKVIVEINSEIMRFSSFLNHIQGQDLNIKEFVTYRESDKRITRIKIKFRRFK